MIGCKYGWRRVTKKNCQRLHISTIATVYIAVLKFTTFVTCTKDLQSMDEAELNNCKISWKEWRCPVISCNRILSRKQTLQSHLLNLHQIKAGNPWKRYKLYETDPSIPIPKSTHYAIAQKARENAGNDKEDQAENSAFQRSPSGIEEGRTNTLQESTFAVGNKEEKPESWVSGSLPCGIQDSTSTSQDDASCEDEENNWRQYPEGSFHDSDDDLPPTVHDEDNCSVLEMDLASDSESEETALLETFSDENNSETDCNTSCFNSDLDPDPPLYVIKPGEEMFSSNITKSQHVLTVSAFASRHNLSDTAIKDMLQLIQLHVPQSNTGETSITELKKKSGFDRHYLNYSFYCDICKKLFAKETEECITPGCGGSKADSKKYFVTSDLKEQIQEILLRSDVWQSIEDNKNLAVGQTIFDIRGSKGYKELQNPGCFLHSSSNLTLSMFTDGVPLFKSSGTSIWPVYFLINELPPKERFLRKNMLLWGIWQGCGKPKMNMFLRPLVTDLIDLYKNGLKLNIANKVICVKAMLIVATMDLQARAYVTNMTQHNGEFGCLYCLEPGKVVPSGKAHCRIFPFKENPAALRTKDEVRESAKKAVQTGKREQGFLGESVLSYLPYFSLETNIVIDYMHGTLLGITKKLLELWFDSRHKNKPFYIGHKVSTVDKLLSQVKPPYVIHRIPRAIANNFQHWKASELRNWLLFYSLPCLQGVLDHTYLVHFSCLVESTYILLGEGITEDDLGRADKLLKGYVANTSLLYGEHCVSMNVHNLLHLVHIVRQWGPLWAYSCFAFESFNGELKRSVHGKGNVCRQIFWTFQSQKRIAQSADKMNASDAKSFIDRMMVGPDRSKTGANAYQCKVIKLTPIKTLPDDVAQQLKAVVDYSDNCQLMEASKIVRNGYLMYSINSTKVKKHNSYTIALEGKKGVALEVQSYIMHGDSRRVFAIGKLLTAVGGVLERRVPHLLKMKCSEEIKLLPAETLQEPLMVINREKDVFAAYLPNNFERD